MKLNRIKLNALSGNCLPDKEMNAIIGGYDTCRCSCAYYEQGGSCSGDNMSANGEFGYYSTTGCNQYEYHPDLGIGGVSGSLHA